MKKAIFSNAKGDKGNKTFTKNLIDGIMTYDYTLDEYLALVKYPESRLEH